MTELKEAKREYEQILQELSDDFDNKELLQKQENLSSFLDTHEAWNLDDKIERVLQKFQSKELKIGPW